MYGNTGYVGCGNCPSGFVAIGICSMFMNSADPQNDVNAPNLSGLKCFGNRPCFGCLPNGELVKVGGYPDTVFSLGGRDGKDGFEPSVYGTKR